METDLVAQNIWQNELEFDNWFNTVKNNLSNAITDLLHPEDLKQFFKGVIKYILNAPFNVFGTGGMFPRRGGSK